VSILQRLNIHASSSIDMAPNKKTQQALLVNDSHAA